MVNDYKEEKTHPHEWKCRGYSRLADRERADKSKKGKISCASIHVDVSFPYCHKPLHSIQLLQDGRFFTSVLVGCILWDTRGEGVSV